MVTIKVGNGKYVLGFMEALGDNLSSDENLSRLVRTTLRSMESTLKKNTPVRTGRLKSTIRSKVYQTGGGIVADVGFDTRIDDIDPYVFIVEARQGMIRRSFAESLGTMRKDSRKAFADIYEESAEGARNKFPKLKVGRRG